MKRKITTLALAATMLLGAAPAAFAGGGSASNNAPGNKGCQPGANSQIVTAWELLNRDGFYNLLVTHFGYPTDPTNVASMVADRVYAFNDHNGDGLACVMQQHLPNAASGSTHFWIVEDNHPIGGR